MNSSDLIDGENFNELLEPMIILSQEQEAEFRNETTYFSDLTEDQLMALFCEVPLLWFQMCSVFVYCKRSGTRNKLHGFIRVAEQPPGADLASQYVFNRESNDSIVCHNNTLFVAGTSCSIPARNDVVQIHAKLYLTTDKDFKRFTTDDIEWKNFTIRYKDYHNEMEDKDITKTDDVKKVDEYLEMSSDYDEEDLFDDDVEKDDADDFLKLLNTRDGCFDTYPEKEIEINDNEPFEFCDEILDINLSDVCCASNILKGKGGSVHMFYVALKYAVDATVEVEFFATDKDIKVDAIVRASYGNNFYYGSDYKNKQLYKVKLFLTNPQIDEDDILVPGKLNMRESVLAVPVQFPLIIDASFVDIASRDIVLEDSFEFHVPRDGSSSYGSIAGTNCYIKLKVDWKLPPP